MPRRKRNPVTLLHRGESRRPGKPTNRHGIPGRSRGECSWVSGSPAPSFPSLQGRAGRVRVSLLETVTVSSLAHSPHRCFPVLSAATQDLHQNTGYEVDDIPMSTEHRSNFVGEDGKRPAAIGLLCAFARRERWLKGWARNEGHRVVVWLGRNQQPASHASSNAPPSRRRRMLLKKVGSTKRN